VGNDLVCSSTDCPLSINTWYHLVDTYDGTYQKLYLNGVLKAIRTPSGKNTIKTNFFIGYIGASCCQNWNGYIDDLGIYNRALTLAEVQTLNNSAVMPTAKKPVSKKNLHKDFLFIDL
jgi:hypothetical protein